MKYLNVQKIKTVPEHYTSVMPWLISASSADLIEFLKAAFEAEEIPNSRITNENGVIIQINRNGCYLCN